MSKKNNETKTHKDKLEEKLAKMFLGTQEMSKKEFNALRKALRKEGIEIVRF